MPLKIHFLNVGHGDCTVIAHPSGRLSVIDINNGAELDESSAEELVKAFGIGGLQGGFANLRANRPAWSQIDRGRRVREYERALARQAGEELVRKGYNIALTNPIEFLRSQYPHDAVHRYIQTHPDMDHMRGVAALIGEKEIVNVWDTAHEKEIEHFFSDGDEADWQAYQDLAAGKHGNLLHLYRGMTGVYFAEDPAGVDGGDRIEILSPTPAVVEAANKAGKTNNLSYVLRIAHSGVRVILAGDAEEAIWDDLVAEYGENLKCDVLKASHHGRDSGYHQRAVELMRPQLTVVSVGTKPDTDATNKYRRYSDRVWSTRWRGNIAVTISDDGKWKIDSEYDR